MEFSDACRLAYRPALAGSLCYLRVKGIEQHVTQTKDLRKLLSLRDSGLITEQDYDQKKAEILRRL